MSNILVLGAGFVAAPLVEYLVRKGHAITLASHLLHEAEAISDLYETVSPIQLDVSDADALSTIVRDHDLVVSFVPYVFHIAVAKVCIKEAKHLVTASYETDEMRRLNQAAKDADVTVVNEIGLDPGIDHLSAMKIFDEIHQNGESLDSFVSWCGGIPAPSANDNPLGYKFSWSPKSVLLALLNDAKYIKDRKEEIIPSVDLLLNLDSVKISDDITLEGYANRDSTSYVHSYGIDEARKVLRGTLRYQGFGEIMQSCKELSLFNQRYDIMDYWSGRSWQEYLEEHCEVALSEYLDEKGPLVTEALEFLGLIDGDQPGLTIGKEESILDAFCDLLTDKLAYADGESDMVVMQHQFTSTNSANEEVYRTSTLVLEGEPAGYSAMAKTVGTPSAIAADMILSGEISRRGVVLPLTSDFYEPILTQLAQEGIELLETTYTNKPN